MSMCCVRLTDASTSVNIALVTDSCCTPLLAEVLGDDDAVALAESFKVLADPVRLEIVRKAKGQRGFAVVPWR